MRWIYQIPLRIRSLFQRRQVEQELEEEFRYHLDREIQERITGGLAPEAARDAARRAMGGLEQRKEECRDARRVNLVEGFLQDLRYAARTLRHHPGFTIVAVLSLTLGIGANTAIFTVVEAALVRSLPYREPDRLVHLWETRQSRQFQQMEASYPNFEDWQRDNTVFESLAGYNRTNFSLIGTGTPERVSGTRVTANFFEVLGVQPQMGRVFRPEEDGVNASVAVVTHEFWQRLGGDANVLGRSVNLSGVVHTVIGVLPPGFHFSLDGGSKIWVPLAMNQDQRTRRTFHWLRPVARLRPGVTFEQAESQMSAIATRLGAVHSATNAGKGVRVVPLQDEAVGGIKPILLVLLAASGLLLLLSCVNVASLLLARATARGREIAIRAALGAGGKRLVRQFLTESVLLFSLGGIAALIAAQWGSQFLVHLLPPAYLSRVPELAGMSLRSPVVGFAAVITLSTAILFGLLPALHGTKLCLTDALKEGAGPGTGGSRLRLRGILVTAQVAIALVLLAGTGLVLRSLGRLLQVDPGFRTNNLATIRISVPAPRYRTNEQVSAFYAGLLQRVASQPGMRNAALVDEMPVTQDGGTAFVYLDGRPEPPPGKEQEAVVRSVSRGYFEVMGIPLIAGRYFAEHDTASVGDGNADPLSVVLTQSLAQQIFPGEDPIGRRLYFKFSRRVHLIVVGVVGDVRMAGLDRAIRPALYTSLEQDPSRSNYLMIRSDLDIASIAAAVRKDVAELDREVPAYAARRIDEVISSSEGVFFRRSVSSLLGAFGLVAVVLAGLGLYGVMSFTVTQRVREIGVRMALGARPSDALRLVMQSGLRLAGAGLALGLVAVLALARLLSGLLYQTAPNDPITLLVVGLLVAAVALVACFVPARRATRVDPFVALRHD